MFKPIFQFFTAFASEPHNIMQVVRRHRIEQNFITAKTTINADKTKNALLQQQGAEELEVTWNDVLKLDHPYSDLHSQRLKKLEAQVVQNNDENDRWFLKPVFGTVEALQAERLSILRDRVQEDLTNTFDTAFATASEAFGNRSNAITGGTKDVDRDELQTLVASRQDKLSALAQSLTQQSAVDKLLDTAEQEWAAEIEAAYIRALKDRLEEFNTEERPKLDAGVARNQTAAYWIDKILRKGENVRYASLSGVYQQSDQHMQDQLINTVTLAVTKSGELVYRARERDAGGRFSFEKNYMDPTRIFRRQAKDKPLAPTAEGPEDRELPFALRFLDQVPVPAISVARIKQTVSFELHKLDSLTGVLQAFAGEVQEVPLNEEESRYRDLPYITNYPGTECVIGWLDKNIARKISVALRPDGLLAVVVKLNDHKQTYDSDNPEELIKLRMAYNEARLMSLLVVALITRVLNGTGSDRCFPTKFGDKQLSIPSFCVWPLQVDPYGAVTKATTVLEQFASMVLKLDNVPRWAVGWSPPVQANALAGRFTSTTERHLRVLNSTDAGPIIVRKGVNEHDALFKLTVWFKFTCLLLGALWAGMVLSTLWTEIAYTEKELWAATLVFSVIGIWRCLICWGLSAHAHDRDLLASPSGRLSRLTTWFSAVVGAIVERAFAHRLYLLTGPAILFGMMTATFFVTEWQAVGNFLQQQLAFLQPLLDIPGKLIGWISSKWAEVLASAPQGVTDFVMAIFAWLDHVSAKFKDWFGATSKSDAAGFNDALYKGVWALPLLAIGLMRQGYLLLYDLVLRRGQLQRKLTSVEGLEKSWAAGLALPSLMISSDSYAPALPKETVTAISAALRQMKTRVKEDISAARSRFAKGSATNAALVAVIGLLAPFDAMHASKYDNPSEYERLSAELKKEYPDLDGALNRLAYKLGQPSVTRVEVTPEVLADLHVLNSELTGMLTTLQQIQSNKNVTISAYTEEAQQNLRALSKTLRQTTQASSVGLDADIETALRQVGFLKAVLDQMREGLTIPVTIEGESTLDAAPWLDVDLAFINALPTGPDILPPVLGHCETLGGMRFDTNEADTSLGVWFKGRNVTGNTELSSLLERLREWNSVPSDDTQQPKRIYIIGLADAQGNAVSNLSLSKRRADAVKAELGNSFEKDRIVTLPLGEAGWLSEPGLPQQEDDASHRTATVYLCPKTIQLANNQDAGGSQ